MTEAEAVTQSVARINLPRLTPDVYGALAGFTQAAGGNLDPRIAVLVKVRASELNACPFCLDMWVGTGFTIGLLFLPRFTRFVAATFTALTGAAGSWTQDGHLVEATVSGIDVFDLHGRKRSLRRVGASPLGPLGESQEIVATATGVELMDIVTGAPEIPAAM